MFGNLVKILQSESKHDDEEVLAAPVSLKFIKLEAVSRQDLPAFLNELKVFSEKLGDAITKVYRDETTL
jgi:hypothetical protein